MKRVKSIIGVLVMSSVLCASMVWAEDVPTAWRPDHRPLADTLSTITEGLAVGMDVVHDIHANPDRRWTALGCDGLKYGIVQVAVESMKHITQITRPDGSDRLSFPSGHATNAFASLNQWQWGTSVTLAIGTGYLRTAANRHRLWPDIIGGAMLGAAINMAVSSIPACHGMER